jgi:hypothetical protein
LIKRAGVGAAVVWATPALTSVGLAAASGTPACNTCAVCPQPVCGPDCGCVTDTTSGKCFCHQGTPCRLVKQHTCTSTSQCPPGYTCALSCCKLSGVSYLACLPPCGTVGYGAGADDIIEGEALSTG